MESQLNYQLFSVRVSVIFILSRQMLVKLACDRLLSNPYIHITHDQLPVSFHATQFVPG